MFRIHNLSKCLVDSLLIPFEEKKELYFNPDAEKEGLSFKSRSLLHSMYAFAKSKWGVDEIQKQKKNLFKDMLKFSLVLKLNQNQITLLMHWPEQLHNYIIHFLPFDLSAVLLYY